MNRRDFLKATLAGLAVAVLPKSRAEAGVYVPHSSFMIVGEPGPESVHFPEGARIPPVTAKELWGQMRIGSEHGYRVIINSEGITLDTGCAGEAVTFRGSA